MANLGFNPPEINDLFVLRISARDRKKFANQEETGAKLSEDNSDLSKILSISEETFESGATVLQTKCGVTPVEYRQLSSKERSKKVVGFVVFEGTV